MNYPAPLVERTTPLFRRRRSVPAARACFGWSQQELARRAQVGLSTVKDFERGDRKPIVDKFDAMRRAIEASGVSLVFGASREETPN